MRIAAAFATVLLVSSASQLNAQTPAGVDPRPPNATNQQPAFAGQTRAPESRKDVAFDVVTVVEGLANPWGMTFLPDGRILVTEKPGRLRIVSKDGQLSPEITGVPPVDARNQGGLLDVSLHPRFAQNQLVYWSFSEPHDDRTTNTAVARGKLVDGAQPRLENVEVIYHQKPNFESTMHYGGRLVWNRDGTLFVTQGERSVTPGRLQAQNLDSGLGKIVRINDDGTIPKDNPFVGKDGALPEIWSIGHRNVQAATLNPSTGALWEVEHGTRGGDEINVVEKGKDYGWPTIAYGIEYQGGPITGGITQKAGMEQPVYYWDPVIAPSGMVFYTGNLFPAWKGSLFIGGLASQNLVRLDVNGKRITGEERLLRDMQPRERIRDVRQGPEGALYLLTDNPKGRVLKLVPKK
jgi:glucose/arabinose dehydrogenase